jgi:acyl-CoA thioesterase-1
VPLLALVLLVGVGVGIYHRASAPPAGCRPDDSNPVTEGSPVAVVLGDSYSAGAFLPNGRREAWPSVMGERTHWKVYVNALSGTGVTNTALCEHARFADRVKKTLRHHPQILVVQTGLNDSAAPAGAVRQGLERLLSRTSSVPRVVVVGPPPAPIKSKADLMRVDAELSAACRPPRCQYVSALGWRIPYLRDRLHPTAEGHVLFGQLVAAAVARSGAS